MKHELDQLNEIISVSLHPRHVLEQKNQGAFLQACIDNVQNECYRIIQQWKLARFGFDCDQKFSLYIQYHQQALTLLLDQLFDYVHIKDAKTMAAESKDANLTHDLSQVQATVYPLLDYLRIQWQRFIDPFCRIPISEKEQANKEWKLFTKKLKQHFSHQGIDDVLIDICLHPFLVYIQGTACHQKNHDYLKKLQVAYNNLMVKKQFSQADICLLLLQHNYNQEDFYNYYLQMIHEGNEAATHPSALCARYYYQQKLIHQLPDTGMPGYNPDAPSIREQIGGWLSEEIYYLEKKWQFDKTPLPTNSTTESHTKVHTNLSVDQLSLAVKLLADTGIIQHKNNAELMRLVAKNFQTKNSEQLSESSLRNKLYTVESSSARAMQHVIVGLLNEVRKY